MGPTFIGRPNMSTQCQQSGDDARYFWGWDFVFGMQVDSVGLQPEVDLRLQLAKRSHMGLAQCINGHFMGRVPKGRHKLTMHILVTCERVPPWVGNTHT